MGGIRNTTVLFQREQSEERFPRWGGPDNARPLLSELEVSRKNVRAEGKKKRKKMTVGGEGGRGKS